MRPDDHAFAAGVALTLLIRASDHSDLHLERVTPVLDGDSFTNRIEIVVEGIGLELTVEAAP